MCVYLVTCAARMTPNKYVRVSKNMSFRGLSSRHFSFYVGAAACASRFQLTSNVRLAFKQ